MPPTSGFAAAIDSNDLVMSYIPEAVWGTTPATPAFQSIRLDSEGFSGQKTRTRPNEIDPSGQSSAAITTKQEASGSLNWSVSPSLAQNELLAASVGGVFTGETLFSSATAGVFTTSASSTSARTVTLTVTGAVFTAPATGVGQYVKVTIVGATTKVFFGRIASISSATVLNLDDCTGDFANFTNTVAGTSTIQSIGMFFTGAGTAFTFSASDATNKVTTLTVTGATFQTAGTSHFLVKGQFVKLESSGSPAMNMIARVKSVTSGTVVVLDCCSVTPVDGALTGASGTSLRGACLRNGTTINTYTFEKKLSSTLYLRYAGSFPTGGTLDVGVGDYLKGTMAFICKSEASATTAIAGSTYSPSPTNLVVDSIRGIGTVWRNNDGNANGANTNTAPISGVVQKIGMKWNKEGAAGQYGIGSSAALGMRSGKILVTGNLSTYFANFNLYNEYLNETSGAISFYALDDSPANAGSNGYVLTFCNATIMNPKIVAGGPGQDVMADFEIEGNPDISAGSMFGGKTIQIDYFV